MVTLPTKQQQQQQQPQKNGRLLADDLASSSSSSSVSLSLVCSMVTPMLYIGLGILLYHYCMATTAIDASLSSLNIMATTTTTITISTSHHSPPVNVSPTRVANDDHDNDNHHDGCRFTPTLTNYRALPSSLLQPQRNDDMAQRNIQQQQLQYNDTTTTTNTSTTATKVSSSSLQWTDPTKVVFYHLNVPETYGAYWNRYMARTYHAVCGPYAYSIDQPIDIGMEPRIHPESSSRGPTPDRTKTWQEMQDLGWHNCQWITGSSSSSSSLTSSSSSSSSSSLVPADHVSKSVELIHNLQQLGFHVHIVIPCPQDILSHRLSICSAMGAPLSTWLMMMTTTTTTTKVGDDNDTNDEEDELCSRLIHNCNGDGDDDDNNNNNKAKKNYYFDETLLQTANSSSFVGYQDLAQVDRLVAGYLPERGYLLPRRPPTTTTATTTTHSEANTTSSFYFSDEETTTTTLSRQQQQQQTPQRKHYSPAQLQEVQQRCGARVQEYFQRTTRLYQACANARQPANPTN
jgi:hypothetical protein